MAANSLFSSYNKQIFSRPVSCVCLNMSRGPGDHRPEKRRRMEEEAEEDDKFNEMWDEDIEFSQADIHSLDVMASQAYQMPSDLSSSKNQGKLSLKEHTEFYQPQQKGTTLRLSRKHSSSTSSLSLSKHSSSNSSSYPSTVSCRQTIGSCSISSSSTDSSIETRKGVEDLSSLKSKLELVTKEKSQITEQLYSKDGEIKMLRELLRKKDTDLSKLREDRLQSIEEISRQKSAVEDSLKTEAGKLETQMQFREQEFKELQDKYRLLEHRMSLHSSKSASPCKSPVHVPRSPHATPRQGVRPNTSPQPKSTFPSPTSFMADEGNGMATPATTSASAESRSNLPHTSGLSGVQGAGSRSRMRRLVFSTHMESGEVCGTRLVDELLQHQHHQKGGQGEGLVVEGDAWSYGVLRLLQAQPSTPSNMQHLHFNRDHNSTVLSPTKGSRLSDVHCHLQHQEFMEPLWPVCRDHHQMAVQGVRDLLTDTCGELRGAVLILPLIHDYLVQYLDMLTNTPSSLTLSPVTSFTSSSLNKANVSDSSLESLTGSMSQLVKECHISANNLEYLALASLKTLLKLVKFSSAVRKSLMNTRDWNHNTTMSTPSVSTGSSASRDVEMESCTGLTSSSETETLSLESRVSFQQLQQLNLLHKIAVLAQPLHQKCNINIVEEALNIIVVLASLWSGNDHVRLHQALCCGGGVLFPCLEYQGDVSRWGVATHTLSVLSHLTTSRPVAEALCTKSERCPLLQLCMLSVKLTEAVPWSTRENIYTQTVTCLSQLLMEAGCSTSILSNNCLCGPEVGRCLLTCLLRVYQHYSLEREVPGCVLHTLHSGLLLMHHCQQRHPHMLAERDLELQDDYVALVCALTSLYKHLPGTQEAELNALSDLWDFNQDDSELSPDSDQEEMDTKQ